jgi:hypothetical protein
MRNRRVSIANSCLNRYREERKSSRGRSKGFRIAVQQAVTDYVWPLEYNTDAREFIKDFFGR